MILSKKKLYATCRIYVVKLNRYRNKVNINYNIVQAENESFKTSS